jgi:hypothetical protein
MAEINLNSLFQTSDITKKLKFVNHAEVQYTNMQVK